MKIVVGLGNPGHAYVGTRHNVGFDVLEVLAARCGSPQRRARFQGEVAQVSLRGQAALLVWPLTWMNLSGSSVLAARDFYKVPEADILVVCDDFQLPLGTLRIRGKGSGGGQNGLSDVIRRLGSEAVPRLRVGIGPVPPGWKPHDFVLGRFSKEELADLETTLEKAAKAVEEWGAVGIEAAMNRYN
jgi:PTH1 family peptidyl-tRNA hydrolase